MSSFEAQCVVGEDHFCIEVPTDCSVGDALKVASGFLEQSEGRVKDLWLWDADVELNCDHLFADYGEPEGIYQVFIGGNCPEGTLLNSSESALRSLG
jgi:hypothetical protein